jgi:hypothetical protein
MRQLRALLAFDLSRCRFWLAMWLGCCAVQAVAGVYLILTGALLMGEGAGLFVFSTYALFVILAGRILLPSHPGRPHGFLRTRPVSPNALLGSRLLGCVLILLLPHFMSLCLPLCLLHTTLAEYTAFAVYYWGIHLCMLGALTAVAAGTPKISSYLLVSGLSFSGMMTFAQLCRPFVISESTWIPVRSPETSSLLWASGMSVVAGGFFIVLAGLLYRGGRPWKIGVCGFFVALVVSVLGRSIEFISDGIRPDQFVSSVLLEENLNFKVKRSTRTPAFETQRNDSDGTYSTYGQMAPPYYKSSKDQFWFIRGNLEIEGLDPELAYSARLLETRWIAPNGEVIEYTPPAGTFSIRNLRHLMPPAPPTHARLVTLLGEEPVSEWGIPIVPVRSTDVLLFGAWTSIYERFKTTPGRLEIRVQVDLYSHDSLSFPLNSDDSVWEAGQLYRFNGYDVVGDTLTVRIHQFSAAQQFTESIGQTRSSGVGWMLHDAGTGERWESHGFAVGSSSVWQSVRQTRSRFTYESSQRSKKSRSLSNPEALELIRILPSYLGSREVSIVVEDFSLVPERSIEEVERSNSNER